jgi:XTP/dITP diphosphohydrolase
MKNWIMASFNPGKIAEFQALMPQDIHLISLKDIPQAVSPEESGDTLAENAELKANYAAQLAGLPAFADDTGLMVDALNGAPGVHSARYAGMTANHSDNIIKLLNALQGRTDRQARFETVLCLVGVMPEPVFFSGILKGTIASEPKGSGGFGYDSVFIPEGFTQTLAEVGAEVKNQISHRGNAMKEFQNWLSKNVR